MLFDVIRSFDHSTVLFLNDWATRYPKLALVASEYLIAIPVLVLLALWILPVRPSRRHRVEKAVVLAIIGVVVALAIKSGMNWLFLRDRPHMALEGISLLARGSDPYSFPSGHSLVAWTIAWSLWRSRYVKVALPLMVVALGVSLGRVLGGVHYPTDVIAGALLGIFTVQLVFAEGSGIRRYLPS